jgi:hypothetical protein
MSDEIKNRVSESSLITFDLEDYYPKGNRIELDISVFLFQGVILKEKEFRSAIKSHNWEQYQDSFIALTNTNEALVPAWAFMLIATQLNSIAKNVVFGNLIDLENVIFSNIIESLDLSTFVNKPIIIKGCSNKPIPENSYILLIQKLQPIAKSIMYGEACSSVPLFKKKK